MYVKDEDRPEITKEMSIEYRNKFFDLYKRALVIKTLDEAEQVSIDNNNLNIHLYKYRGFGYGGTLNFLYNFYTRITTTVWEAMDRIIDDQTKEGVFNS